MGKFDPYKVDLKGMRADSEEYQYLLDNQFFANIDGEEIPKGKIEVHLLIIKTAGFYNLNFTLNGIAVIPCDRCLDDMDFAIETNNRLVVKLGRDYAEESEEIIVIPETEGTINLAWFLYEFAALAIPIKHVHAPGKCNKQMSSKLKEHIIVSEDEDEVDDDTTIEIDEI
ncbi:DUF177 domain-containing protein [Bacteroidales bacterium OttesenSCG-928-M11]|nr:DUF177 domain-containing protein [Bacteroidales bacterium OttesenSCG-928-M11]